MLAILIAVSLVALLAVSLAAVLAHELLGYMVEDRHVESAAAAAARVERDAMRAEAIAERHAWLERIQRPQHEPYPVEPDLPDVSLTRTEDDDIAAARAEAAAVIDAELAARAEHGL